MSQHWAVMVKKKSNLITLLDFIIDRKKYPDLELTDLTVSPNEDNSFKISFSFIVSSKLSFQDKVNLTSEIEFVYSYRDVVNSFRCNNPSIIYGSLTAFNFEVWRSGSDIEYYAWDSAISSQDKHKFLDIQKNATLLKWCENNGYTDLTWYNDKPYAFPPNGVMPVQIKELEL